MRNSLIDKMIEDIKSKLGETSLTQAYVNLMKEIEINSVKDIYIGDKSLLVSKEHLEQMIILKYESMLKDELRGIF